MQKASTTLKEQERKIRDQVHPELRDSQDVAFLKKWPLQEQFNCYWHALNALITFDDSLPSMYRQIGNYDTRVISREAEKYYEKHAHILVSAKAALLAPQEQGLRFVANGMNTSEIVSLATKRKGDYDSNKQYLNYIPTYLSSSTVSSGSHSYNPDPWGLQYQRNGQQRLYNQQQSFNSWQRMMDSSTRSMQQATDSQRNLANQANFFYQTRR